MSKVLDLVNDGNHGYSNGSVGRERGSSPALITFFISVLSLTLFCFNKQMVVGFRGLHVIVVISSHFDLDFRATSVR